MSNNFIAQNRRSALWNNPIGLIDFMNPNLFIIFEKWNKSLQRPFPSRPTPRPLRPTPPLPPFLSFKHRW
ncbi:MAG: hypothetical protein ACFFDT_10345 [Candidatus Hodarchaeota archaeon]